MAPKITSSSTRNKRSTKKPVTKGQDPQRSNRQKVSKATVSTGDNRKSGATPKAPSIPKGTAPKAVSALTTAGRFLGRASAVLTGAELFKQGRSGSELDKTVQNLPGIKANQKTDIGKRASDAISSMFKPASNPRGPNPANSTLKGGMVNGRIQMTQVAKPKAKPAAKPKPVAPKAATTPTRSSALGRSSAPARTPTSRPAAKPAAKPKAPASMATESSMSASDIMKGYGMRVNQTFSAESPSTSKKRQSLKDQTAEIKKMIEESKKRQGKG